MTYETAVNIAIKMIKLAEGCNLMAYPDPGSELYAVLLVKNMLRKYMKGEIKYHQLDDQMKSLKATPWTCGWGETSGVTKDTVWTQQEADDALFKTVKGVTSDVARNSPQSVLNVPTRLAAFISLAYNIGMKEFKTSTALRKAKIGDHSGAAEAIKLFNKSGGKVMNGLITRRQKESDLYKSQ